MNQIKIGKFIAESRKDVNLTQMQLAEKLGITDRAVSKWERGIAMPDSSIMLELCEILKISVNELLKGERITMENNNEKNQELLLEMSKEIQQKNKIIWTNMWTILIVSLVALLGGSAAIYFWVPEGVWQVVGELGLVVVFLIPCLYALKLEVSVGVYKCKNCGHEFVPTYKQALRARPMVTTRHLQCPNCQERTWCKKVIK